MNKILAFCSFGLLSMIFAACDPLAMDHWYVEDFEFKFVNNSQDTVGYSVYGHKINTDGDVVSYIMSGNSIAPAQSKIVGTQYRGIDDDGSWANFFEEESIDTLYICIAKEVSEAKGQKCKLPDKDSVLKVYKFYDKNTDLMHTVSPTITYP